MARQKKAHKISKHDGVFDSGETIDKFGRKAVFDDGEAQELEAHATTPFEDSGTGQKYILRCFTFAFPPQLPHNISKQRLFSSNKELIERTLWGDGLISDPQLNPRVVVDRDKKWYKIFVLCEPRRGHLVLERTQTLQDILHSK